MIGKRNILYVVLTLCVLFVAVLSLINSFGLELDSFRVLGFGSGESSSINSRIDIFKNNFLIQLNYNPLFGNTMVDTLTTGEGSYVHSLLSLLTHLGIVGFLIFTSLVFFIYKELGSSENHTDVLYGNRKFALYRFLMLSLILFFALISSSYIWMPIWFSIGLFGAGFSAGRSTTSNQLN